MDVKASHGFPDGRDKGLSGEDRKRVDENVQPVVLGLPWSEAGTNLYLTIYGSFEEFAATAREWQGRALKAGNLYLVVGTSNGKPEMSKDGWGMSLELPVDLGRDELKQQYLIEWIIATTTQIFEMAATTGMFTGIQDHRAFPHWLAGASEDVIRRTGL